MVQYHLKQFGMPNRQRSKVDFVNWGWIRSDVVVHVRSCKVPEWLKQRTTDTISNGDKLSDYINKRIEVSLHLPQRNMQSRCVFLCNYDVYHQQIDLICHMHLSLCISWMSSYDDEQFVFQSIKIKKNILCGFILYNIFSKITL